MSDLLQVLVSGLAQGGIYAFVALGLTVIYRSTSVLNFMHSENFMVGAFLTLVATSSWHLPMLVAIAVALSVVFLVGVIINKVAFEPLLKADHLTQVFATVAVLFIIRGVVRFFTVDQRPLAPILGNSVLRVGDAALRPQDLLTTGVLAVATGILALVFLKTHLGRVMRAGTQSLRGCSLIGIDVRRMFAVMWGVGGVLGALAGILAAPTLLVFPDMGARPLLLGFAGMTLGGFGSLPGAIVGGLLVGLIEVGGAFYGSTTLGDVAGFLVILVVLLVRPHGLFGSREVT